MTTVDPKTCPHVHFTKVVNHEDPNCVRCDACHTLFRIAPLVDVVVTHGGADNVSGGPTT